MTFNHKRTLLVVLLLFLIASGANYYLSLGVLPRVAGLIMVLGIILTIVFIARFAPTREEIEDHRRRRRERRQ